MVYIQIQAHNLVYVTNNKNKKKITVLQKKFNIHGLQETNIYEIIVVSSYKYKIDIILIIQDSCF